MRFTSKGDYFTMLKINRELVNRIADNNVILYKINQQITQTNSYGEATKKVWYTGVLIPCLIDLQGTTVANIGPAIDVQQTSNFFFLRKECQLRSVYPEIGDIIDWNEGYYEIHNINEIQVYAGREEYSHTIEANTHLSRRSDIQLEPPTL